MGNCLERTSPRSRNAGVLDDDLPGQAQREDIIGLGCCNVEEHDEWDPNEYSRGSPDGRHAAILAHISI